MSDATFLGLPAIDAAQPGDEHPGVAILGIPFGVPYPSPGHTAGCADAPDAIRARSRRLANFADHHDFDLDAPMLVVSPPLRVVDAGDVNGTPDDGPGNAARAEVAVRSLLATAAIPIVLGGDDSVPIPVLRAYAGGAPLTILQVDAHLDFRDEVAGVRDGYSSPMRRASEMDHVERIVQVGLRGVGSARPADVAAARAAGNVLITARELREGGVPRVLEQVPQGASLFIVVDLDGLDPSVAPAVSAISPGGLSYDEVGDLMGGAAARCHVVGAAFTELVPALDVNGLSALVVVRMVMRLLAGLDRNR
ncbi:MAG: arginase family protein [Chloroflexi bacterium]|nr:arginase family protein [Chloroflexota bacterium]